MGNRAQIHRCVGVAGAVMLLATAAFLGGCGTQSAITPSYEPVSYTLNIHWEDGEYVIEPGNNELWKLHPADKITFINKTKEDVSVFPVPLYAYTEQGNFEVTVGGSIIKTVNELQLGAKTLSITHSFGAPGDAKGPKMVVTDSETQ